MSGVSRMRTRVLSCPLTQRLKLRIRRSKVKLKQNGLIQSTDLTTFKNTWNTSLTLQLNAINLHVIWETHYQCTDWHRRCSPTWTLGAWWTIGNVLLNPSSTCNTPKILCWWLAFIGLQNTATSFVCKRSICLLQTNAEILDFVASFNSTPQNSSRTLKSWWTLSLTSDGAGLHQSV